MYRIGYIDEDNGWLNTFYNSFKSEFDVVLFEIKEDTQDDDLVAAVFDQNIDMLVIDFRLDETGLVDFNADTLVQKIQERNLYYPMIVLTSHEIDAFNHLENANLVNGKDMLSGANPKIEILKIKINKIINDYYNKYDEVEAQLKALEKKRTEDGLEPNEEDDFVELNNYIDKTTDAKGHISRTFYSEDTNRKLDELISTSHEMLKLLDGK